MPAYIYVAIALVLVLMLGGLALIFYRLYRVAQQGQEAFARAVPATATVLSIGDSSTANGYGGVDVELRLQIMPFGRSPYKVRTVWSVEPAALSKIQPGSTVAIKIDRDHPRKIYSAEEWAESLDAPHAGADTAE